MGKLLIFGKSAYFGKWGVSHNGKSAYYECPYYELAQYLING